MRKLSFFLSSVLVLGLACGASAQTHLGVVSLDTVTGYHPDFPGMLAASDDAGANLAHVVSIRFDLTANSDLGLYYGSNAWEVYSPDGADWVNLLRSDGPLVTALDPSVAKFRKYYVSSNSGVTYTSTASGGATQPGASSGATSRVAYSLATVAIGAAGYSAGSSDIAVLLQFETREADSNKTMCLDSLNGHGTVAWEWAAPIVGSDFPQWDNGLGEAGPRCWTIKAVGEPQAVEVGDGSNLPTEYSLAQNYPNPFNPVTNFDFALPKASNVELTIFNVLGQKVVTLINEKMDAGTYRETWSGTSESGAPVASGIYFYRLTADEFVTTKKMMMLK